MKSNESDVLNSSSDQNIKMSNQHYLNSIYILVDRKKKEITIMVHIKT